MFNKTYKELRLVNSYLPFQAHSNAVLLCPKMLSSERPRQLQVFFASQMMQL